jgi:hypothetical protein
MNKTGYGWKPSAVSCFQGKAVDQVLDGGIQDVADSALPDILLDGGQFPFADG